jgi:2-oxoglutarate dehydrogenase E2 component (dihydrolipoamide succinyltransferase)
MPQMGESIAEGTIVRWIKKVGDSVDRDEPLFEISTDKVDAEIPSPAAGVLTEIQVKEGETVPVNSVVATIGAAGEIQGAQGAQGANGAKHSAQADGTPGATVAAAAPPDTKPAPAANQEVRERPAADLSAVALAKAEAAERLSGRDGGSQGQQLSVAELRQKSSPLVRKIAKEHNVDISNIHGSGIGGRVTKQDILGFIESFDSRSARDANGSLAQDGPRSARPATEPPSVPVTRGVGDQVVPMSVMRKKIAEHMVVSRRTSAHVYSVFEVNYSRVDQIRKEKKDEYERLGAKLTFTSFIAKVVIDGLRRHKVVNASIDGDNIIYRSDINLGVAVALENGLIVPVVKAAGEKNILGLSKAIQDVADRARAKKLNPEEVHGGTFTITNPGNFGAQFGLPIINQPQVAILGVGNIEKRPVVIDDMIGIRLMGFLTLGYDHRLIDGAVADQFMADVKKGIEQFDPSQV